MLFYWHQLSTRASPKLMLFRALLSVLNILQKTHKFHLLLLWRFFSSLTRWAFIELSSGLNLSDSIANETVIPQPALVHLSGKIGYAILYPFNLIQKIFSHLVLDAIDKISRVSEVLLEENLKLNLYNWCYHVVSMTILILSLLEDDASSNK